MRPKFQPRPSAHSDGNRSSSSVPRERRQHGGQQQDDAAREDGRDAPPAVGVAPDERAEGVHPRDVERHHELAHGLVTVGLHVHGRHRHHRHHRGLGDDHGREGQPGPRCRADDVQGVADRRCLLPAVATDAAGQHEGVGPEADRDVDHGEDEEHRGEQPGPRVLAEAEPRLAGVLGGPDQQRTEDRAEGRREHDPAHRPAAVVGFGEVGGGVAGQQVRRLPAAEQEQPEQEHGQLLALGADRRDQPAGRGEGVPELQAGSAPSTAHQARQRLGQERGARRDRGGGDAAPTASPGRACPG